MSPATPRMSPPPTPFIGREAELARIADRLLAGEARLLTLVGPAGVGKTRLALEAATRLASHFPDGVVFVDLAPVREPTLVIAAVGRALGLADSGPQPMIERCADILRAHRLLLLLDNFEHLLGAAGQVGDLAAAAERSRLLVTSRALLRLRCEQPLRLAPLAVPDAASELPIETLVTLPAVALFVARAQWADFVPTQRQAPLLAGLVRRLDGLPLALELAAAHLRALPLAVVASYLSERVELRWEAPDLPERQRSLQAALDWSYDLLPAGEQRLFRLLGVFVGQVPLAAIAAVAGEPDEGPLLGAMMALAEKSLVVPARADDDDPEPWFGLLETVRQYARARLVAEGALESASLAHAHYLMELTERADPELRRREQSLWFARLERGHDNLRAALRWLLDHDEPAKALRLAVALGDFWLRRGYHAEGVSWLNDALRNAPEADPAVRTQGLLRAGIILLAEGDVVRAGPVLEEALALARRRKDRAALTAALAYRAGHAALSGELQESRRLFREAIQLVEELDDDFAAGFILHILAHIEAMSGNYRDAVRMYAASAGRFVAVGALADAALSRFYLALALRQGGEARRAVQVVRNGLRQSVLQDDRHRLALGVEATLLLVGEAVAAERGVGLLGAAEALYKSTGSSFSLMARISGLGVPELRSRVTREGLDAPYRAGRALPPAETVSLALAALDEFERSLPGGGSAEGASRPGSATPPPIAGPPSGGIPLSARERAVLRLVGAGHTNKVIARELFIAPSTVNYHLTSAFNKLGVDTRAQAVATALQRGML